MAKPRKKPVKPLAKPLFEGAEWDFDLLKRVYSTCEQIGVEELLHADPRWVDREEALTLLDGAHRSDELLQPVLERAFAALGQR